MSDISINHGLDFITQLVSPTEAMDLGRQVTMPFSQLLREKITDSQTYELNPIYLPPDVQLAPVVQHDQYAGYLPGYPIPLQPLLSIEEGMQPSLDISVDGTVLPPSGQILPPIFPPLAESPLTSSVSTRSDKGSSVSVNVLNALHGQSNEDARVLVDTPQVSSMVEPVAPDERIVTDDAKPSLIKTLVDLEKETRPTLDMVKQLDTKIGHETILTEQRSAIVSPVDAEMTIVPVELLDKPLLDKNIRQKSIDFDGTQITQSTVSRITANNGVPVNEAGMLYTNHQLDATSMASHARPPSHLLSAPIQHPHWGGQFANHVSMLVNHHVRSAEIRLDPPQMGKIDIQINLTQDGTQIVFVAEHQAVRDAIEQAVPRLREALVGSSGMQLDVNISSYTQSGGEGSRHEAFNRLPLSVLPSQPVELEQAVQYYTLSSHSQIDVYA